MERFATGKRRRSNAHQFNKYERQREAGMRQSGQGGLNLDAKIAKVAACPAQ
jgi:hypothetical protein